MKHHLSTLVGCAAAVAAVGLTAGCTSSPHATIGTATPRASSPNVRTAMPSGAAVAEPAVKNDPATFHKVAVTSCAASGSTWTASGTARNDQSKPVTYSIKVVYITTGDTDVAASAVKITVPAQGKATWKTEAKAPGTNLRCIVTGATPS